MRKPGILIVKGGVTLEIVEHITARIDEKEVLRLQGYKKHSALSSEVAKILTSEIEEGYNIITPKAIYTEVSVIGIDKGLVKLDNDLTLNLGSPVEDWENASSIGVAICTIGSALEERAGELFSLGEFPSAVMLDCVGSVAVGNVADSVNYRICQKANRLGIKVGARFSPGIGRWDLSQQGLLFHILDGKRIGVGLNDQYMMLPKKSRSFCLGIGKELVSDARINSCRHCGVKECQYRKEARNG